jgi:hypothetical protein
LLPASLSLLQAYGAATQQAATGYGAAGAGYAQQQGQQAAYGAYSQQAGAYPTQAYGQQQQVGQKRDGDAYASYGAGYGADYNKRPRY